MIKYICERPVKVVDSRGNINYMPCGHCDVCVRKKVNAYYSQLSQVIYNFKHALFIHPTYSDTFLPRAEFVLRDNQIQLVSRCERIYNRFGETDILLKSFDYTRDNINLIDNYLNKFSHRKNYGREIGIINYKDVQDFFKRIRTYYKREKGVDSTFKYFCVCEYGGHFKRPHYHIIFLTNDSDLVSFMFSDENYYVSNSKYDKHSSKFWRFGYCELQRVENRGSSASYISSYVTTSSDDNQILHHSVCRPSFRHSSGLWDSLVAPFRHRFHDYANMQFEELREATEIVNGIPQRFIDTLPAVGRLFRQLPNKEQFTAHTIAAFLRDCEADDTPTMIYKCINRLGYDWIYSHCEKNFKLHRYADRYKNSYQIDYAFKEYIKGFIYKLRSFRNHYVSYFSIDYWHVCRYLQILDDIRLFHVKQFYINLQLEKEDVTGYYYVDSHRDSVLALRSSNSCRQANKESRFKKLHINKVYELSNPQN